MKILICHLSLVLLLINTNAGAQGSTSATYTTGDIPTSADSFDITCNGNNILLSLTLPGGESYTVTGMDISYNMTSESGQMANQRSQIKCVNNNTNEATVYSGIGATTGTFSYNRSSTLANGTYAGGARLDFEMHAWRVTGAGGTCSAEKHRVDAGSWTMTVYYGPQNITPKVGINNSTPSQTFEVNGKLKLGDDTVNPTAGTVRWNSDTNDFEGYDGTQWLSFTSKGTSGGWGSETTTIENAGFNIFLTDDDNFGNSVSISGNSAIAGAPGYEAGITNAGRAVVYTKNGTTWTQQQLIAASDPVAYDFFGTSVSISGDYAIVGAPFKDVSYYNEGRAYIFKRNGTVWSQQAILSASDAAEDDFFGNSVSISGDYAIVGAYKKDVGANTDQGKAYIFKRSGTSWSQQSILTATGGATGDEFGYSTYMSGNYVIVGAPNKENGANTDQGKVYVFNRVGSGWLLQNTLVAADGAVGHKFGYSVCLHDDYAIAGTLNAGKAYIFKRLASAWSEQAVITVSDAQSASLGFGSSVSINSNYAVVGADRGKVGANTDQGKAYIFHRTNSSWLQQVKLGASDGLAQDKFGGAVSISGNNIIVGAPYKNFPPNYTNTGKIYFFYR